MANADDQKSGIPGDVPTKAASYHTLTWPLLAGSIAAQHIYIATQAMYVNKIRAIWSVVGGAAAVVHVEKVTGTTAPDGGTALHADVDLTATVNTLHEATITASDADRSLAAGDKLGLDFDGTLTGLVGIIEIELVPLV